MSVKSRIIRGRVLGQPEMVALCEDGFVIDEYWFEGCTIVGPMVLIPLRGFQLRQNKLGGTVEELVWELPDECSKVGGIGLRGCLFERCRFVDVGFAGPASLVEMFRADLGEPS